MPHIVNDKIASFGFTGVDASILLCITRHTYGYSVNFAPLSATYIARYTKRSEKGIRNRLRELEDRHVILKKSASQIGGRNSYAINENFEEWQASEETSTGLQYLGYCNTYGATIPEGNGTTIPEGYGTVDPSINKTINKTYKENSLCDFFEEVWSLYPRKLGKSGVTKRAKKELAKAGVEIVTAAVEAYKKEIEGREEQFILYGSTFFNGRWKDYAPAAIEEKEPAESTDRFSKLAPADRTRLEQKGAILPNGALDYSYLDDDDLELVRKAGID